MASFCNGFETASESTVNSLPGSEIVQLNVGGALYTTSRATLIRYPDSMLGAMFSGIIPTACDSEGRFFIDRDGSTFGHVLNFLRCGQLVLPADFSQLDLLAVEADFYRVDPLIEAIAQLRSSRNCCGSFLEIIEVRVGPTATMPTNNSRDKTVLSCRRDIVGTLPSHFFKPTAERFQCKPPFSAKGGGEGDAGNTGTGTDEQESSFVELELVGSNVRLRLGEHLRRTGWTLCHSDMSSSSSSCGSQSSNHALMIEHSFRDRWYLDKSTSFAAWCT